MSKTETEDICEGLGEPRSLWKMFSFNIISFGSAAAFYSIQSYAFYFWEVEIGLAVFFVTLALVIYGIWDAINDPLMGFISDRPTRFTKKWGRRFPWIVIGYFFAAFFALFVFLVPSGLETIGLFLWFTIFLLIFELFSTAGQINHDALYPQLFRTNKERLYTSTLNNIPYFGSLVFGMVIPPLFFIYGDPSSFLTGSLLILVIAVPFLILGIPGIREDKRMIEQVLKCDETRQETSYIDALKRLITNKNFIANLIYYIAIRVIPALGFGSILYFVRYNLGLDPSYASLMMLTFLIGGLVGILPWLFVAKKIGFYKAFIITVSGLSFSMLGFVFVPNFTWMAVFGVLAGFFVTGVEIADTPLSAYMIDDVVVREGHRPEGVYYGVRNIIIRISTPITAIAFGLTHVLTGFDPTSDTQTPLAQFGIRVHFGLIPFIIGMIGLISFILLWDLKGEKMEDIWAKMKEMDL